MPNDIGDFIVLMIGLFGQLGERTEDTARREFARLGNLDMRKVIMMQQLR